MHCSSQGAHDPDQAVSNEVYRLFYALNMSSGLLIEIPRDTRVFRARFARQDREANPVALSEVLDRLDPMLDYLDTRIRAVALVLGSEAGG